MDSSANERRRHPRLDVMGRIQGRLTTVDLAVTLMNLSEGGFLIESPVPVPLDTLHEFLFTVSGTASFSVRARALHSIRITHADAVSYVVGLTFVEPEQNRELMTSLVGELEAAQPD